MLVVSRSLNCRKQSLLTILFICFFCPFDTGPAINDITAQPSTPGCSDTRARLAATLQPLLGTDDLPPAASLARVCLPILIFVLLSN